MTPTTQQFLTTLIAAILPALLVYLLGRRKTNAEIEQLRSTTAKKLVDSYGALVEDLQEQIQRLESKQEEVYSLREKVDQLIEENRSQRTELAQAEIRMTHLETEVGRLRAENHKLGVAAEHLRQRVLDKQPPPVATQS